MNDVYIRLVNEITSVFSTITANRSYSLVIYYFMLTACISSQCATNTPIGSTIAEFNWQEYTFDVHIKTSSSAPEHIQIPSPFHPANYSAHSNVIHLSDPELKDYQVEDGWEALYVNFGTSTIGVAEPSFGLYNRYDGKVRVFFWLSGNESAPFNSAIIRATTSSVDGKVSALFENVNSPANALSNFDPNLNVQNFNNYEESEGIWVISEFITAYDPCSCDHASAIRLAPTLVSITTLELETEGTSITQTIMSGGSIVNETGFTAAVGHLNDIFGTIATQTDKGQKLYKNLDKFSDELNSFIIDIFSSPSSSPTWLNSVPDFLGFIPQIGLGLHILDFVVGGGKKSSSSSVTTFMERHQYNTTGELTTIAPYENVRFFTPGSDREGYDDTNISPIYDNVLGVANVVTIPIVKKYNGEHYNEETDYDDATGEYTYLHQQDDVYQLSELKYAINEHAGINTLPKSATGYLVFRGCLGTQGEFMSAGLIRTGLPGEWRTPELPLGCLLDYQVTFNVFVSSDEEIGEMPRCNDINVKLKLILERDPVELDAQEIIFMQSYLSNTEDMYGDPPLSSFTGANPLAIDGVSTFNCKNLLPLTNYSTHKLCSKTYDPTPKGLVDFLEIKTKINVDSDDTTIKLFPNPSSDILNVTHQLNTPNFQIIDLSGRILKEGQLNSLEKGIKVNDLQSGYYIIRLWKTGSPAIHKSFIKS